MRIRGQILACLLSFVEMENKRQCLRTFQDGACKRTTVLTFTVIAVYTVFIWFVVDQTKIKFLSKWIIGKYEMYEEII